MRLTYVITICLALTTLLGICVFAAWTMQGRPRHEEARRRLEESGYHFEEFNRRGDVLIDFSGTPITDEGFSDLLPSIKQTTEVRYINLARTSVTDDTLRGLEELALLHEIDLRSTNATANGIHRLRLRLPGTKVLADFEE